MVATRIVSMNPLPGQNTVEQLDIWLWILRYEVPWSTFKESHFNELVLVDV